VLKSENIPSPVLSPSVVVFRQLVPSGGSAAGADTPVSWPC